MVFFFYFDYTKHKELFQFFWIFEISLYMVSSVASELCWKEHVFCGVEWITLYMCFGTVCSMQSFFLCFLFIFICLDGRLMEDNGVLKTSIVTMPGSICAFPRPLLWFWNSVQFRFSPGVQMYGTLLVSCSFGQSELRALYISWLDLTWSLLSDVKVVATTNPVCSGHYFHLFTLNYCLPLDVKCISWR